MSTTRIISKEIGTALAVLAIYLLTVLAPLHQARASQLVFEQLGFASLDSVFVLCGPSAPDRDGGIAKCPAAGVGKNDLIEPTLAALPAGLDRFALAPALAMASAVFVPAAAAPPSGSRAPPESV